MSRLCKHMYNARIYSNLIYVFVVGLKKVAFCRNIAVQFELCEFDLF